MRPSRAEITPLRYVATVLRRRRTLVLGCAILGAVAGIGVAAIIPPSYTAKAQLVIDAQAATIGNLIDNAAVDTRVEILMSDGHLRRVLKSLQHDGVDPAQEDGAAPSMTDLAKLTYVRLIARLASLTGNSDGEEDKRLPPEDDLSGLQLEDLQKSMNVYRERRSLVISVTYRSPDPVAAAAMANKGVEVYVDNLRSQKAKARSDALRRLDERVSEARASMEAVEGTLRRFATAHGFLEKGEVGDEDVRIAEIIRQLATARSELAERRHRRETTSRPDLDEGAQPSSLEGGKDRAMPASALTAAPAMSRPSGPLADMSAPFAATKAPSIESDARIGTIESDTSVIEARVRYLERWQSRLQDARAQSLDAELTYRDLERTAASSLQNYDALLRRQADLLAQEAQQPDASFLSLAAVPAKPSSPDTILFILPATLFACLSGGLLAVMLERGNHTIRSPRLLDDDEHLSDVVLLPHVSRQSGRWQALASAAQPFSTFTDSLRLVSVMGTKETGADNETSSVCLITSSGPAEGKSTLAISLAAYMHTLGRNVLLVDMDFRRPGLSDEFKVGAGKGIVDLLRGLPASERIKRNQALGIDYLPLPRERIDPMLVLAHRALPQVLQDLRRQYDIIVIDGSYVLGTPDAELLSRMVDRVILVARWGHTTIEAAQTALAQLRDLQSSRERVCNVLTMVRMEEYRSHRFADMN